jgi:hypothetical protein
MFEPPTPPRPLYINPSRWPLLIYPISCPRPNFHFTPRTNIDQPLYLSDIICHMAVITDKVEIEKRWQRTLSSSRPVLWNPGKVTFRFDIQYLHLSDDQTTTALSSWMEEENSCVIESMGDELFKYVKVAKAQ